jgi:hypothetical protein
MESATANASETRLAREGFGHADDGEGFAVGERDSNWFDDVVAAAIVEEDTSKGGTHFEAIETGGFGGVFTSFEEQSAEAAAGPVGMYEKGADFCGVGLGIEEFGFTNGRVVAAEESFAFAPTAAGGDDVFRGWIRGFDDVVGLVFDELGVETENGTESAFDLCRSVIVGLEDAHRPFDEGMEHGNVGGSG